MKKKIKIKLVGFFEGFDPKINTVMQVLNNLYDVEIDEKNPDYIICSVFGTPYEYCKYPQIRIMISGENYIPDFNLVDYGISSYPLTFKDRHFRKPQFFDLGLYKNFQYQNRNYTDEILEDKVFFANFICGHESENNIRGDFFKKLCKYKRVESAGTYLNNMPNGLIVDREHKLDFQKKCKFTLCFESTKHEGFITEKIADAFLAGTIPVYYGSSDVNQIFNKNAFINVSDYASFGDVINKIIELDNDDEKYLEMLRQPVFVDSDYCDKIYEGLENFLKNIFDQPIESAYRRSRVYSAKKHNDYLVDCLILQNMANENNTFKRIHFKNDIQQIKKEKGKLFAFLYWLKHFGGII